jgi:transposase
MATKHKRRVQDLPILHPDAAGIDIGSNKIFVAVPAERDPESVRSFSTFTRDLYDLADWLQQCRIKSVAMESTSVYWIPLYQILETRGFEVFLVNAQHVKNVPGRKTDVSDCQWLQYLHSVGLLRSSFRPPEAICAIRSLWRHRGSLIQMAAEHVLHMQKALDQMNLQLHRVLSDITGLSGLHIVDAILAGERDPITLARLCHSRVKSSLNTVAKSLEGDYRPEHVFALRQSVAGYRYYQELITEVDKEIQHHLADLKTPRDVTLKPPTRTKKTAYQRQHYEPKTFDLRTELHRIFGGLMYPVSVPLQHTQFSARLVQMLRNFEMRPHSRHGLDFVLTDRSAGEKFFTRKADASEIEFHLPYASVPILCTTPTTIWATSFGAFAAGSANPRRSPQPLTNLLALCFIY